MQEAIQKVLLILAGIFLWRVHKLIGTFEFGTVEEKNDLGPYKTINASDIIQTNSPTKVVGSNPTTSNKEHDWDLFNLQLKFPNSHQFQ